MNNMCIHLTKIPREDEGSTLAECGIRPANQNSKYSQIIMAAYSNKTNKIAMDNGQCQFYYESQKRNDSNFITECPCNPRNPNFNQECPCNR